ncbi:MAG: LysR family transcriptional regulator [Oscillospiraceae bacterium]|nr:LysR family transcriptional regulator [Oscillospiraceae bacterium]MBO7422294.1 LysR family transcriptional regulator [Oscillospiraceae bacterium]
MDLRALKYFVTAAEEMNMTRAAERLGMSQPPLSSQIKNLEDELHVQLLIRGKRSLKMTDAGEMLYRRAKQILELAEQTKLEMESLEGLKGSINISLVEGRAPYLLARWIAGFRLEFPQVTFRLWNGDGDEAIDRLRHGLADVALIAAPYDVEELDGFSVGREPWVAILSKSHPLAQEEGEFIPLKALAGEPLIIPSRHSRAKAIRAWFEEIGEEPNIVCELSNYIDAEALAEQNVGICIYPLTTYAENNLLVKKIIIESARQIEYFLVRNRGQHNTELVQEFINFVEDCQEEERLGKQTYLMPEKEYFPPEGTKSL